MGLLGRRSHSVDDGLLAEARRRLAANAVLQEEERVRTAQVLAPLYFELEETLAPLRVAGFAERTLPACGWLAETRFISQSDGTTRRKERKRLLAERVVRQPQLAFEAGNGIVLALEQGSGRVSRFYRGDHGVIQPYGVVQRLEDLAVKPAVTPRRNACVLVPRGEAYDLFSATLKVAPDDRDALADRMRIAVSAAHRWCGDFNQRGIYEPGDVVQTGGALLILLSLEDDRPPDWTQVYDSHHTVRAETDWAPH
jgi:hypothetical protein